MKGAAPLDLICSYNQKPLTIKFLKMKKLFFRYILGMIPAIAFFNGIYAQNNKFAPDAINSTSTEVAYADKTDSHSGPAGVNTRALKDFNKTFKGIDDANWFKTKEGFIAEFNKDGIFTRVDYDRKGRNIAMIRRYGEDKLPKDVRHLVKSNYYDYNIYLIIEVTYNNIKAYLVKIEDEKNLKTIRVIDGEWDVYEDFQKSK
jgi:hypothetical protein